jgi:hypothetical protein
VFVSVEMGALQMQSVGLLRVAYFPAAKGDTHPPGVFLYHTPGVEIPCKVRILHEVLF